METSTHIAIVPTPGFSHLVPILEFSKLLLHINKDLEITCFIPSLESPSSSTKSYLQTLPSTIHPVFLPPIPKNDVPQKAHPAIQIHITLSLSMPFIRQEMESLNSRTHLVALIADIFAYDALDVAKELNISSYIYYPSPVIVLSLFLSAPKLDQMVSCAYRDLPEPIRIPGCVPVHGRDLSDGFQDRSGLLYQQCVEQAKGSRLADGIIVNSFVELEGEAIRALQEETGGKPHIYAVGPITQNGSSYGTNRSECLRWLDNQPPNSVLYVSFGSGGTLSEEQLNELALGLELSSEKFLWVVRKPSSEAGAAYLGAENEDPLKFLPIGFLERNKEQGLVVSSWAPQIEVLNHNSVGGFLSHCGWNSTLESIEHGVPIIAWPLFAEQRTNAVLLTDGLKVAIRPKANENGIVEGEEVAIVIRSLMDSEEGKGIRQRMEDLKIAAANALKVDGSSTQALSQLADKLRCV